MDSNAKAKSCWHGIFLSLNCFVGIGNLAIPWAFSKGGWLLGVLSEIFITLYTLISAQHLIQIMSHVEILSKLNKKGYLITPVKFSQLFAKTRPEDFIVSEKKNNDEQMLIKSNDKPRISFKRYSFNEMITTLLGKTAGSIYSIALTLSVYGTLIAYSSIFASSLASIIPIFGYDTCNIYDSNEFADACWKKYWFYLLVLLILISVLAIIELKEQDKLQAFMSFTRFLVFFLMIGTSIAAISANKNLADSGSNDGSLKFADSFGVGITLPIVYCSNAYLSSFPVIIQHIDSKSSYVPRIIHLTIVISNILFTLIGILVPLAAENLEGLATLSWIDYTGGFSDQSWWSLSIMYIVILFPAIATLTAFQFSTVSACDNILSMLYGKYNKDSISKKTIIIYRFLIISISILTAAFFYDLGPIFDYIGLSLIISYGIFLPSMTIASRKLIPQHGDYDNFLISEIWSWLILFSSLIIFIASWIFIIIWTI